MLRNLETRFLQENGFLRFVFPDFHKEKNLCTCINAI